MANDTEETPNPYWDLPDDSELAFAVYHSRKYSELDGVWESNAGGNHYYYERRFVDQIMAFDQVHGLDLFSGIDWHPPSKDEQFWEFFQNFRRSAEMAAEKFRLEAARRAKQVPTSVIVLDATTRPAIQRLIEAIREKLNALSLSESKREALFNKLNAFAAEVDRNRTRTEAAYAFGVDMARMAKDMNAELKDVWDTIDRMFEWIEKAKKAADMLPGWKKRREIEAPPKQIEDRSGDLDDDIPF